MEQSREKNDYPGGTSQKSSETNPSAASGAAGLHSDSGRSPISLLPSVPLDDHLASGAMPAATSGKELIPEEGKGGPPGSISSVMGGLKIGSVTEDEQSSRGTATDLEPVVEVLRPERATTAKSTGSEPKKKESTSAQKAKKGYKNALMYLRKMSTKSDVDLTEKEKVYIAKNKKIVTKYERDKPPQRLEPIREEPSETRRYSEALKKEKAIPKSTELDETKKTPPKPNASKRFQSQEGDERKVKKPKPSTSFESPQELQIAIVDRSDLDGKMSTERWLEVERRILVAIASLENDDSGEEISFDGAGWQKGVKVVGCSNRKSLDFLKGVVEGCSDLGQGVRLEIISKSLLPLRKITSVWVPPPNLEDDQTLKVIEKMNKGLSTKEWMIISSVQSKNGNGKEIVLSIDENTLVELKKTQGRIKFGLGSLKFRLPNDPKENSTGASGGAD